MIDGTDITIRLTTEGDTTGAFKVGKALSDVERDALKLQQQEDILEAKRRQSARTVTAQVGQMQNFGLMVNQVGYQVTDFATQVQMGTSAVTAFAQQMPQAVAAVQMFGNVSEFSLGSAVSLGTAISLIVTEIAVGFGMVSREWDKMRASQNAAEAALRNLAKVQADFGANEQKIFDARREEWITAQYKEQAEYLERQVEALKQANALRAAQGDAAAAAIQSLETITGNAGGNTAGIQAAWIAQGADNSADVIASRISEAEANTQRAARALDAANIALSEAARKNSANDEAAQLAFAKASTTVDKATAALDAARASEENIRAIAAENLKAIESQTVAAFSDLTAGQKQALTDAVTAERDAVAAEVARLGANASTGARGALALLEQVLADNAVDPQEIAKIREAQGRMNRTNELYQNAVLDTFNDTNATIAGLLSAMATQKSVIEKLNAQVTAMDAKLKEMKAGFSDFPPP